MKADKAELEKKLDELITMIWPLTEAKDRAELLQIRKQENWESAARGRNEKKFKMEQMETKLKTVKADMAEIRKLVIMILLNV